MKISKTEKHRPSTWEKMTGIKIYDPDGWRNDGKSFLAPINAEEWNKRQIISTCLYSIKASKKRHQ